MALVNLANTQRQLGGTKKAVTLYEKVLKLEPKNSTAALNLGNAYQTLGQHDKAEKQ